MDINKTRKITKYALSSALLFNPLVATGSAFAADAKIDTSLIQSAVNELLKQGILEGNEKGDLNLEGKLTRIQVAALMARALQLDVSSTPKGISFSDVSADSWGAKYINALSKIGVFIGSDGKFRPNDYLTKEEFAVILVRITQTSIEGKGNNIPVSDADQISNWAKPYVQAAIENGFIFAVNGKFTPKEHVVRQEVVVEANNLIKSDNFEQYKESIGELLKDGKKISNSDPTI
ncbi:S-layer homology domain-containing protein [Paenibacillus sepulcri]|uniref:S-layer homology domain-containing protein n=1 Tax=Paenibacillus sepulcri TaxID=359917 RepID=A0ABS7BVV8_9BACL|nr:S-layer homology domain-containing protein [Paenibacillus sepulcri]